MLCVRRKNRSYRTYRPYTYMAENHNHELVRVGGLVKHFPVEDTDDVYRAVDGVSFEIMSGETLGLVGE